MVKPVHSTKRKSDAGRRARTTFLVAVSLYVAFELWQTGAIESWLLATALHVIPGSFIAGAFFTSLFTLAPAGIVLAEIGSIYSPWLVAMIGAAGAVLGDLFLFMFVRDSVAPNVPVFLSSSQERHLKALMRHPLLHWLLPAIGALIIASPLPDELGLALMGFSRVNVRIFVPISYAMNFLGILLVALAGDALL